MRVDPSYVTNLVSALDQAQSNQQQLSAQLASGMRIHSLSDDPIAAGQNVMLLNQIHQDDSFTQSANLVTGQLQVADSALGQVIAQLTQAISLATSANNGTMNASDRQAVSNQLAGIRSEVLTLANSSYQGQYIFAGGQASTAPFTLDSGSPSGISYNGDANVNFLETPNGQKISLSLPGDQIFDGTDGKSVFAALNSLIADYSAGGDPARGVGDGTALSGAMSYLSQQRVTIDNSISQIDSASSAAQSQQTQLTAAQTTLIQADVANVATQLSLSETQQSALESVIAQLAAGSLFDKLRG